MKKSIQILSIALLCVLAVFGCIACAKKHTHEYIKEVVDPTCTEQGYTIYTCSCGDTYNADYVDALGHNEDADWTVIKEATNTEVGEEVKYCSRCGQVVETQVIEIIDAYKVTFVCDENSSVSVYSSQDYTIDPIAKTIAYSVDKMGAYLKDGEGQVNFKVTVPENYTTNIVVEGTYKNLKDSTETLVDNVYRITKIASDLTVTISAIEPEAKFNVTFEVPEGFTIGVYDTQDYTATPTMTLTTYTKNSETGENCTDGDGQCNFIVYPTEGTKYTVTVTGTYKNLKDSADTLVDNVYRITKISSDIKVTITVEAN